MLLSAALAFSMQPYIGLGEGELDWNIAADLAGDLEPDVLSELQFTDLESETLGLRVRLSGDLYQDGFALFIEGDTSGSQLKSGTVTDADYASNGRQDLWSLSRSEVVGNGLEDVQGLVGLAYRAGSHQFSLMAGGYYSEQDINFQKGVQLVAEAPEITTPIDLLTENLQANLDSDYRAEWQGGWLGLEYNWSRNRWSTHVRLSRYWGQYYGEGRWNLRASGQNPLMQPRSFSHEADSDGSQIQIGLDYRFSPRFSFHLTWQDIHRETGDGTSITYFADETFGRTRFNGAEWQSSQVQMGVVWSLDSF